MFAYTVKDNKMNSSILFLQLSIYPSSTPTCTCDSHTEEKKKIFKLLSLNPRATLIEVERRSETFTPKDFY